MRVRLLVVALLLAGCNDINKPAAGPNEAQSLCQLTNRPHATSVERTQLRDRAKAGNKALTSVPTDRRAKAIFAAALEITTSGVELHSNLPSPLATALAPSGSPYGLPTLERALTDLGKACDQ